MRDNVEDLDIDSLLQANLGDGEVNFDILDLSVTGTFFQSEDGNDLYEVSLSHQSSLFYFNRISRIPL